MTPAVPAVLAELAGLMMRNADPAVPPADRAGALGISALLLAMAAETWDGQVERLVEENRALRALLARGEAHVGDHFRDLIGDADGSLRISSLKAANDRLRAALVRLHEAVEAAEGEGARALEAAIWVELRTSTERRRLMGSPV